MNNLLPVRQHVTVQHTQQSIGCAPSFLKPQWRWIPKIAGEAARLGTLAVLGYTGYQAYTMSGYSLADTSLAQNALFMAPPVLAAQLNKSALRNLATWTLWNPIQKETLQDPDQVLNKAVLESKPAQEAVEKDSPGSMSQFADYLASVKRQALLGGLLYTGVGTAMTIYYLNQFG